MDITPDRPSLARTIPSRTFALVVCLLLSVSLNATLRLHILPQANSSESLPAVVLGRAAVAIIWVAVYRAITGEEGINPLLNAAISLGAPALVDWAMQ